MCTYVIILVMMQVTVTVTVIGVPAVENLPYKTTPWLKRSGSDNHKRVWVVPLNLIKRKRKPRLATFVRFDAG
jgi:hypothetical protein